MTDPVRVDPLPAAFGTSLRIAIDTAATPRRDEPTARAAREHWRRLCASNPGYFDGPILTVLDAHPDQGLVRCAPDSYQWLAVRPHVDTGAVLLAVTAVLLAHDRAGRGHVLLGRRGERTAAYPGLWEFGPAGGVEPPSNGRASLGHADLLAQLHAEIREETGLTPDVTGSRSVALVHDRAASSLDVVMLTPIPEPLESLPPPTPTWEFPEARWVPLDGVAAFMRRHAVIPPTRALAAFLGW